MTAPAAPTTPAELERRAAALELLLRIRVEPRLALRGLRVGVARRAGPDGRPALLGELRGWALPSRRGLHLDTMRVAGVAGGGHPAVGPLLWAATFAWALEATPCREATLLAIRDAERQHRRLVRYFRRLGFAPLRELGGGAGDLLPRLLWGGSGLLMRGSCAEGLRRSLRLLERAGEQTGADAGAGRCPPGPKRRPTISPS